MARGKRIRRIFIGTLLIGGVLAFVVLYRGTVPAAPPHARAAPALTALPRLSVCWVETAKLGDFTASGLLIRHPKGDVLVDAGDSSQFSDEVKGYGLFNRIRLKLFPGMLAPTVLLPAALKQVGADPARLTWFIPSHAHIDHVGGLVDLPRLPPVLLPAEEIAFIGEEGERWSVQVVPAHARLLNGHMTAMNFSPKPYETFDEHLDLFGDGAIVAVKLPGHTPGSVAVFVNLSPERRLLHAGDSVNDHASLERRAGKPLFQRQWNHDQAGADRAIAQLAQLHETVPALSVLPAHDRSAWLRVFGSPRCIE